jgi:hypothetical protein
MALGLRAAILVGALAVLAGCAYSIKDIDVTKAEPACARQCTATYSGCVSAGNQIGSKWETLRACREAYAACIQTCPAK